MHSLIQCIMTLVSGRLLTMGKLKVAIIFVTPVYSTYSCEECNNVFSNYSVCILHREIGLCVRSRVCTSGILGTKDYIRYNHKKIASEMGLRRRHITISTVLRSRCQIHRK